MIRSSHLKKTSFNNIYLPIINLLSVIIYQDYGISIDEESTIMHGLVSVLNYIK